jgi:hypothetical protein
MNKLENDYKKVCKSYIDDFCKKQDLEFERWGTLGIGHGAFFCGHEIYLSFFDIVWDINSEQPKGQIIEWVNIYLSNPKTTSNYYFYCKELELQKSKPF